MITRCAGDRCSRSIRSAVDHRSEGPRPPRRHLRSRCHHARVVHRVSLGHRADRCFPAHPFREELDAHRHPRPDHRRSTAHCPLNAVMSAPGVRDPSGSTAWSPAVASRCPTPMPSQQGRWCGRGTPADRIAAPRRLDLHRVGTVSPATTGITNHRVRPGATPIPAVGGHRRDGVARGLLNRLFTRAYVPVGWTLLDDLPAERRDTLIARQGRHRAPVRHQPAGQTRDGLPALPGPVSDRNRGPVITAPGP